MKLEKARKDFYRRLSRREGFRSRAAYKLIEVNDRYHILKKGNKVVDFGCYPGGWLQAASMGVGDDGRIVGVDVRTVKLNLPNATTLTEDVESPYLAALIAANLKGKADVILSDLAPSISGVWELDHMRQMDLVERVQGFMPDILAEGGNAMIKVFEGEKLSEFIEGLNEDFVEVKIIKPKASRRESSELYLLCFGYKGGLDQRKSA